MNHCNDIATAPGIFRSRIQDEIQEQEIDLDDLRDNVRNAIESARATNPDVDTGIFLRGRIQTLVSDDNTLYVYESYALGNPELFQEHLNGNLRAGATIVELDPLDGFEYQPPAAPPKLKPSKASLTTTWASVKQK